MQSLDATVPACSTFPAPQHELPLDVCCVRLSERDAEQVMQSAEQPPEPNAAAVAAARRFLEQQRDG